MSRFLKKARVLGGATTCLVLLASAPASAEMEKPLPQGYATDSLPASSAASPGASGAAAPIGTYDDTDPSALTDFREPLAEHGTWTEHEKYGTIWVPASDEVGEDFAPYQTEGHWAMTDDGEWLWVSYYDWGYIPFHYGRWVWVSGMGWAWIPGRTYAPAWVVWRVGPHGYIGWAPMPPTYYWHSGVAVVLYPVPYAAYVFCPTPYIYHPHVHHHVLRKPADVKNAAANTGPYKPATPARPYKPASPPPEATGVDPDAAERAVDDENPKAKSLAFRSRTGASGSSPPAVGTPPTATGYAGPDVGYEPRWADPGRTGPGAHPGPIVRTVPAPPLRPSAPSVIRPSGPSPSARPSPSAPPARSASPAPALRPTPSARPSPSFSPAPRSPAPSRAPSRGRR